MLSAEVKVSRGRPLWPVVLVGTTSAVVLTLVVLVLAGMSGQPLLVTGPGGGPQPVPVGAVVGSTVVGGVAALLLGALARRLRHPRRTFLVITAVGLLLSLLPPLLAATSMATAVWLSMMHLVVAAAIVPTVARRLP